MNTLFHLSMPILIGLVSSLVVADDPVPQNEVSDVQPEVVVEHFHVAADVWCPLNCEPNSTAPGYMVEILKEALSSQAKINDYQYMVLPWNRALKMAREGKIDAVIAATDGEAEGLYLPKYHLGTTKDALYVPGDSNYQYKGVADIVKNNLKVGLITEYEYSDPIEEFKKRYPENIFEARGEEPLEQLLLLLDRKKIDVLIEDPTVFQYTANKNYPEAHFKQVGLIGDSVKLYIAFNRKEMANLFEKGFVKLEKSGRMKQILEKYSVQTNLDEK